MELMPLLLAALMYATMRSAPHPAPAELLYVLYGSLTLLFGVTALTLAGILRVKWIMWTMAGAILVWAILLTLQLVG